MLDDLVAPIAALHGNGRELITFRVARQDFCVSLQDVKEVRGWTPMTLLPRVPRYLCGVINLRGTILPIVDLAQRLKFPPNAPTEGHIVVVVWIASKLVGLLVDEVNDIIVVEESAIAPTSELTEDGIHALASTLISHEGRTIGLIALDQILPALEDHAR
jgi:purine-binding chemotaxis protein CheW